MERILQTQGEGRSRRKTFLDSTSLILSTSFCRRTHSYGGQFSYWVRRMSEIDNNPMTCHQVRLRLRVCLWRPYGQWCTGRGWGMISSGRVSTWDITMRSSCRSTCGSGLSSLLLMDSDTGQDSEASERSGLMRRANLI